MARWTRSVLGAGWLWLLLAACNGGQTGDEGAPRKPDAGAPRDAGASGEQFFGAIRRGFGAQRYLPADSIAELGEWSDQVALGTIAAVHPGAVRTRGNNTAVVELDVAEMLAGEPAEKLYVWFYVDVSSDAAWLPDPPPDNRLLLFSMRSGDEGGAVASRVAVPEGELLYHLTTPQGLAMEDGSGAFTLIEYNELHPIFPAGSFEALIEAVREELQAGDR